MLHAVQIGEGRMKRAPTTLRERCLASSIRAESSDLARLDLYRWTFAVVPFRNWSDAAEVLRTLVTLALLLSMAIIATQFPSDKTPS